MKRTIKARVDEEGKEGEGGGACGTVADTISLSGHKARLPRRRHKLDPIFEPSDRICALYPSSGGTTSASFIMRPDRCASL